MVSPRPARIRCPTNRSKVEGLKSDHFSRGFVQKRCPSSLLGLDPARTHCRGPRAGQEQCPSRPRAISRATPGGYTDLHLFLQPLPLSLVVGDQGGQCHLGEGASTSCQPPDSRPAPDPRVSKRGSSPKALDMRSPKVLTTAASSPSSPDSHSSPPLCGANSGT